MEDFNGCPYSNIVALNDTLTILSGKWKLNIIRALLFRKYRFNELQKKAGDVNKDDILNSVDASLILEYYAYVSADGKLTFEEYLA